MNTSRRDFFKVFGALAAAAVAPSAVANVLIDPMWKYREALNMLEECNALTLPDANRMYGKARTVEINAKFNEMLGFVRNNFKAPAPRDWSQPTPPVDPELMAQVKRILKRDGYTLDELRSLPPVVAEEMYAVLLCKVGLSHYNLPLNPSKMKNFDWFNQCYGYYIVG
jgi:hypothetical protein